VTLINTVFAMAGDLAGGLSGPAIHPIAVRAIHDVHAAHPDLPIVGVGGVRNGATARDLLHAGAVAVQVGTATFADPRAAMKVLQSLEEEQGSH
jgi:dihydroorotate dehydrogenase (NAD+) catalytic subunit